MAINYKRVGRENPNFKNGEYSGPDRFDARAQRLKLAKKIKSHTKREWLSLVASYGNQCAKCKAVKPLHKDHILPISKGGHNGIENIQPLCERCNLKKFTKHIKYAHQLKLVLSS